MRARVLPLQRELDAWRMAMSFALLALTMMLLAFSSPLRAQTARVAFMLLFCCGLRRGELLRLKLRDFDPAERLLRIEGTKFHKSRLVPLTGSVFAEVNGYLKQRRASKLATANAAEL